MEKQITEELKPIVKQLISEGFQPYALDSHYSNDNEFSSIYWFEKGRILHIRPSSWRSDKPYARDLFMLYNDCVPNNRSGSSVCILPEDYDTGMKAKFILNYRNMAMPDWAHGVNYSSIEHMIKRLGKGCHFIMIL